MRISLDFQKLKAISTYKGGIKIRVKVGNYLTMVTQTVYQKNGWYSIQERYQFKLNNSSQAFFLEIQILTEANFTLAQITVFFSKFKKERQIIMESLQKNEYILFYEMKEIQKQKFGVKQLSNSKKQNINSDGSQRLDNQTEKLQILKIGVLAYKFMQRLDPLVFIWTKIMNILFWKSPIFTLATGCFLTLTMFYPKISALMGGLFLYLYRNIIFKSLSKLHQYENIQKRLIMPKQNLCFLQHAMEIYCEIYQTFSNLFLKQDKTLMFHFLNVVSKAGTVLILICWIFTLQQLCLLILWISLLLTSPIKKTIIEYAKPVCEKFLSGSVKMMDSITQYVQTIFQRSNKKKVPEILRQFYLYHYERWSLLGGWQDDCMKYSDKLHQCVSMMKKDPPIGWQWVTKWKIQGNNEDDEYGYQYSNEFVGQFRPSLLIANQRRRRWRRCCVKLKQY